MKVLHIHQDFPDGLSYPNTKAVSSLIEGCEDLDDEVSHVVLSIHRTANPFKASFRKFNRGFIYTYWALPLPVFYVICLYFNSLYIWYKLRHSKFNLIHGHKLSCEGCFAYFLSRIFKIKYVISIRGGSDWNYLRRLRFHKSFFLKVYANSYKRFWVSVWVKPYIARYFKLSENHICDDVIFPNICNINTSGLKSSSNHRAEFLTVMSFHQHKRKGFEQLVSVFSMLNKRDDNFCLNVFGTGEDNYKNEVNDIIEKYNAKNFIKLKGYVSQDIIMKSMANSRGFLLPAKNETFGMAYIEALSVGCPVLYMSDTGIDGYFEGYIIGEKLINYNLKDLFKAIKKLHSNADYYLKGVDQMLSCNYLNLFTKDYICSLYLGELKRLAGANG